MAKIKSGTVIPLDKASRNKVKRQVRKITKKVQAKSASEKEADTKRELKRKEDEKRGLIYIGHIPHGFYEEEMKEYFKQFGKVTNVKVCRSRKTGSCKGYGYVEFLLPEVAKIAAESMNNYLMFKKRVVAEYVPFERRPKHLFQGKSSTESRCSVASRRQKQNAAKNKVDRETQLKNARVKLDKLKKKLEKLQEQGIECATEIKNDASDASDDTTPLFVPDEVDSDVEFKVPSLRQRSTKSLLGKPSQRAVLTKSLDSVKTMLSRGYLKENKDEAVQTKHVKIKTEKKGIALKSSQRKRPPLDAKSVKKIAQELIRKKGNSLLNVISKPVKGKKRKIVTK